MLTKYIIFILIVVTTIMLSISQMFGLAKANEQIPYMPRQINLSGNIVHFSMPENFSKDFPADDLVDNVNLADPGLFKDSKPVELLRRWWNYKDDSFFAKDMGAMMMTVHVYKVRDESKDISHPLQFVKSVMLEMEVRDNAENAGRPEVDKLLYPINFYQLYVERIYNKQSWLRSGTATSDESQMIFHYWIPITINHYLTVEFNFAPANKVGMRTFIDGYAREMLEKIMATFEIVYSDKNPIKEKLEKSSQLKLERLIKELE